MEEFQEIKNLLPESAQELVEEFQKKHRKETEEEFSEWLNK